MNAALREVARRSALAEFDVRRDIDGTRRRSKRDARTAGSGLDTGSGAGSAQPPVSGQEQTWFVPDGALAAAEP